MCRACCLLRARETTVKSMHDHPSERRAASAPTKSRYAQNCSLFPKGNRSPASPAFRKTTHTPFFCHGRSSSSSGSSSQGNTSDRDYLERFQTSPVTASNLPSLEIPNRARCDQSVTQIQQTNSFALLGAKDDEEDDEAGLFDSDEETTRIFLQQPGAGATVRTMRE